MQSLFHHHNQAAITALFRVVNRYVGNLANRPAGTIKRGRALKVRVDGQLVFGRPDAWSGQTNRVRL